MIPHPKKRCSVCREFASYAATGKFFCGTHKPMVADEFVDLCTICCTKIDTHKTVDKICPSCTEAIKNGVTVKRGLKEQAVENAILASDLPKYTRDRQIENGCLNRRPDFRFAGGINTVIIEVDENQHKLYNCACETTRMKQIYFAQGDPSLTFIRYNPDNYKPSHGDVFPVSKRQELLIKILKEELGRTKIYRGITVIYLFYDGFSSIDRHIDVINPYD